MRNRVAACLPRNINGDLGNQRAAERREEWVAASVESVRLDGGRDVVVNELLTRIHYPRVDGPKVNCLACDDRVVLVRLPEVDCEGDDLSSVVLLNPMEHHRCVKSSAVEQQNTTDRFWIGFIRRSGRWVDDAFAHDWKPTNLSVFTLSRERETRKPFKRVIYFLLCDHERWNKAQR